MAKSLTSPMTGMSLRSDQLVPNVNLQKAIMRDRERRRTFHLIPEARCVEAVAVGVGAPEGMTPGGGERRARRRPRNRKRQEESRGGEGGDRGFFAWRPATREGMEGRANGLVAFLAATALALLLCLGGSVRPDHLSALRSKASSSLGLELPGWWQDDQSGSFVAPPPSYVGECGAAIHMGSAAATAEALVEALTLARDHIVDPTCGPHLEELCALIPRAMQARGRG
jgi:hypothetical protein